MAAGQVSKGAETTDRKPNTVITIVDHQFYFLFRIVQVEMNTSCTTPGLYISLFFSNLKPSGRTTNNHYGPCSCIGPVLSPPHIPDHDCVANVWICNSLQSEV